MADAGGVILYHQEREKGREYTYSREKKLQEYFLPPKMEIKIGAGVAGPKESSSSSPPPLFFPLQRVIKTRDKRFFFPLRPCGGQ